jgi:hypothetical protein
MRGLIRAVVWSWTVMARGGSRVCRRCAGSPSGGPEYDPGPVSQHGCDRVTLGLLYFIDQVFSHPSRTTQLLNSSSVTSRKKSPMTRI